LGGIGKSQLALELAYRTRQKYRDCSVFWLPTTVIESLHQAYTDIAQQLKLPGWDNKEADVKKPVQLHLSRESAGQWLLIYDNVDDASLWTRGTVSGSGEVGVVDLINYLPRSEQGRIVFTTRNRKMAVKLFSREIIEMPEIDQDTARRMLQKYLVNSNLANEQHDADLLLKELPYLPLAIVQAAAYIKANQYSVRRLHGTIN
jgi:hypothetical protein